MTEHGGADTNPAAAAPPSGDDRLLLEVIDALRGADNLRDRLLAALQSGTPAVADLAYAVKARVKEDYKVIDKIRDRRAGGPESAPRPTYGVRDVTDLVGLRIITLYRLDVIEVIEALLATIERDSSSSAPFVPGTVSEVIIYSANPTGDVQGLPAKLMALFAARGLDHIARISEKQSNYSSTHILVRGRGRYRDGYRELPVEIQVRTALEDVWGQIEHDLKYKRQGLLDRKSPEAVRLTTTLDHLGALKTMIDGIAQYGDQIKLQIDELEPELRYTTSRAAEEPSVRLGTLRDLPVELKREIAAAVAEAKPALSGAIEDRQERIRILRSALSRLQATEAIVAGATGLKTKTANELRYYLTMQRALIHAQLGNLIEDGEEQLRLALDLYTAMQEAFPARVIVSFRVARTLHALGARQEAVARMRKVVDRLRARAEPTPKNHWIRSAAPRALGVMLWAEANARLGGDRMKPADPRALELLREAYGLTLEAYRADVFDDPAAENGLAERTRAANNLLYFLLDYLELGGEPAEGMGEAEVAGYLAEICGGRPERLDMLPAADTARRAYAHLGRRDLELAAARTVVRLASGGRPNTSIVRDAVRAAERTISEHADGRAGVPPVAPDPA